jgi:hypothetical protein
MTNADLAITVTGLTPAEVGNLTPRVPVRAGISVSIFDITPDDEQDVADENAAWQAQNTANAALEQSAKALAAADAALAATRTEA